MERTKRSWSTEEERALVDAPKFSIIKSWRDENGFRSGHHQFLEVELNMAIPGNTLTVEPHIKSRVHVWKKQYDFLSRLLSKSGVRWNNIQKTVECTKESWNEECQSFPSMKNKIYQPWPFCEDWIEIFDKDRATGDCMFFPF